MTTAQKTLARRLEERAHMVEALMRRGDPESRWHANRIVNRELEWLEYATAEHERRERQTASRRGSVEPSLLHGLSIAGALGLAALWGQVVIECFRELLDFGFGGAH